MHETHPPADIAWLRKLLRDLVVIPSVNPPGDESAVAALLDGRLQAAGFETQIAGARAHRPNLIARLRGRGGGPTLLFTNSGMADECVDLVDVARAGHVYARLIADQLG